MTRRWTIWVSLAWLGAVILVSALAPILASHDPYMPIAEPLSAPALRIPLGTDALGRDFWSRIAHGGRISLSASLAAAAIAVLVGTGVGLASAVWERWLDRLMLWAINTALAIPGLLLAMLLVAVMGPGMGVVVLAVGFGGAPAFAQPARIMFKQLLSSEYVTAAQAVGATRRRIALRHILPNALGEIISLATTHLAWAFMGITTLTFLGLAGDPSLPEWGAMLDQGRKHLIETPLLAILPGAIISLTVLSTHAIGDHLSQLPGGKRQA
jgi:ABC-type dipeptide/oligopeptide/nickel transport system permease subunit